MLNKDIEWYYNQMDTNNGWRDSDIDFDRERFFGKYTEDENPSQYLDL